MLYSLKCCQSYIVKYDITLHHNTSSLLLQFSEELVGCAPIVNIIVSHTDPEQVM